MSLCPERENFIEAASDRRRAICAFKRSAVIYVGDKSGRARGRIADTSNVERAIAKFLRQFGFMSRLGKFYSRFNYLNPAPAKEMIGETCGTSGARCVKCEIHTSRFPASRRSILMGVFTSLALAFAFFVVTRIGYEFLSSV